MRIIHFFLIILSFLITNVSFAAGSVFDGREVYQQYCLGCHGPSGEGMMPGMPNFSRGERLFRSDRELIEAVKDGNGVMPAFYGILKEKEIEDVVAFLRTLL
jgi:cytochrome c6